MKTNTINISFSKELLNQIDDVSKEESRSRSELIREASRMYIERKKRWSNIYKLSESHVRKKNLIDKDIIEEIERFRNEKDN